MQKKLLSLVMMVSCGVVYGDDMHTKLSLDDLKKPMGSLGDSVKNIDKDELQKELDAIVAKLGCLRRTLREKNIDDFAVSNMKAFEKALVDEFSGQADAIKQEYEKKMKENKEEEADDKAKMWDGSLGWIWSSEPTKASATGSANDVSRAYKTAKDALVEKHKNIVEKNKDEVIQALDGDLKHQIYLLESLYLKGLQVCGGDADCLARRKINWHDIQREGFFTEFAPETYSVATRFAKEKGIQVSSEDMKKIAQENKKTADKHKKLLALETEVQAELNKILKPQPESKPHIDLTGEDNVEDKPSIFEDLKEDQNDQGALSQ